MKKLYIIGAGGLGREVAWLVERINTIEETWEIEGYVDDDISLQGVIRDNYAVIGDCNCLIELSKKNDIYAVCAVGSARVRKIIINKFKDSNVKFATVIDPSVIISDKVQIGEGTIVCAGTIITVDVSIGSHVIINLDCTLGHDAIIHDFVTIYPSVNVSGNAKVGECSELGTGMQIIQGKNIGTGSIVGAGAVVVKDIPDYCTAVGSPARPIKFFE